MAAMNQEIIQAFRTGYERLAAWADLIDRINVFPVADGDTGRNMVLSLAPILKMDQSSTDEVLESLLMASRGSSGNITTRFFSAFLQVRRIEDFYTCARTGRNQAWQAVADPKPGTILSIFDALCESLERQGPDLVAEGVGNILGCLENTVSSSIDHLPELKAAGVVDAGALGMFIFFDGFFAVLADSTRPFCSLAEVFGDTLRVNPSYHPEVNSGYCVDLIMQSREDQERVVQRLRALGDAAITMAQGDYVKAHLHIDDTLQLQTELEDFSPVIRCAVDDLKAQADDFASGRNEPALHIVTDSAGSVSRRDAVRLGISLMDSYINIGRESFPESCLAPEDLYKAMREGIKISTSQASVFERQQQYQKLISLYPQALYLCVGSIYTGNYEVVRGWKESHDPLDRLTVIDTGFASGRLGLAVLATARYALKAVRAEAVTAYAQRALHACREYIFLDKLQYLAAGGRISKTSSFFGDLLHMKPVISPTPQGAQKVAVLRNQQEQIHFLLKKIEEILVPREPVIFLLEYTDTRRFIEERVLPEIKRHYPQAEYMVRPISNTSGAHMGPGTWGAAFLPSQDSFSRDEY